MSVDDLLGRIVDLPIVRFGPPGAFLALVEARPGEPAPVLASDVPVVLLLGSEIPEGAREGDVLRVFVHRDSEGRPLATRRTPKLKLGEVGFLRATARTNVGVFVDWGLEKELLVPFAEQTTEMRTDERYAIGVYIDNTGRLAGTMRVSEVLGPARGKFEVGEWVDGEAWRNDPAVGLFVIVERGFVGLVPASEPHGLARGEAASFRVAHVHPDGRIELSLRGLAHEEIEDDAKQLLAALTRTGGPKLGNKSSPDEIRDAVGLSKKAFKRAAGRLLRDGAIAIDPQGDFVVRR